MKTEYLPYMSNSNITIKNSAFINAVGTHYLPFHGLEGKKVTSTVFVEKVCELIVQNVEIYDYLNHPSVVAAVTAGAVSHFGLRDIVRKLHKDATGRHLHFGVSIPR